MTDVTSPGATESTEVESSNESWTVTTTAPATSTSPKSPAETPVDASASIAPSAPAPESQRTDAAVSSSSSVRTKGTKLMQVRQEMAMRQREEANRRGEEARRTRWAATGRVDVDALYKTPKNAYQPLAFFADQSKKKTAASAANDASAGPKSLEAAFGGTMGSASGTMGRRQGVPDWKPCSTAPRKDALSVLSSPPRELRKADQFEGRAGTTSVSRDAFAPLSQEQLARVGASTCRRGAARTAVPSENAHDNSVPFKFRPCRKPVEVPASRVHVEAFPWLTPRNQQNP